MKKSKAEQTLQQVVKQLTALRKSKNLSHRALAEIIGVTRPAISYIESGKCRPTFLLCLKMAEALGVSLGDLIRKAEKE